ncbi:MAG: phage tail tape measure protein [Thermoplasmata archaeon M8B2D]|nr:MAG: phage tail tape measure protein [Thermoplasmata archaeon M8B2D]
MAFEKIGLGSIFSTDATQMIGSVNRAHDSYERFVKLTNTVPGSMDRIARSSSSLTAKMSAMASGVASGVSKISSGVGSLGVGLSPLSLAVGAGFKQAVDYEKQMSAVGAVSRATGGEMTMLGNEAKKMGIVSVFSATQAGEGMEYLARAGARPTEIVASLGGVMNAAAADGIELGQSADIVARIVKGMGKEWNDAGHIADVLALASASSNTNILGLGESFVYGASAAKTLNLSLEETTSLFSKAADAGLKNTLAGTSFTNMMSKLAKPSEKAQKILKKFNIKLVESDGSLRKVANIVEDFKNKVSGIKSVMEKQAIIQEVFGQRGAKAYNALSVAGSKSILQLEEELKNSSKDGGSALEMAKRRLDNFAGSITLLKSSLEGFSIGFFEPLLKPFAASIRQFTEGFNNVLLMLNDINDATTDGKTDFTKLTGVMGKYGKDAVNIAWGLRDAIDTIRHAWEWFTEKIQQGAKWFKDTVGGSTSLRQITKMASLFLIAAAAITPLILGLVGVKFIIGGLISIVSGLGTILAATFWPIVVVSGAVLLAWQLLRRENETFLQTASRVWSEFKVWALDVYQNVLQPMWRGIKDTFIPIIDEFGKVWADIVTNIKIVFADLYTFLFGEMDKTKVDWREVGRIIGSVIGAIAETILIFVKYAIPLIASIAITIYKVVSFVWKIISGIITQIAEGFAKLAIAFEDIFAGDMVRGLVKLGTAILDFVLKPLRLIIEAALALGDALNIDVPDAVRTFAKEGLTGNIFNIPANEKTYKTREEMLGSIGIVEPKKLVEPEDVSKRNAELAKLATDSANIATKKEAIKKEEIKVENVIEDKRQLNIDNNVSVDGESLNIMSSRKQLEIQERSGFKATPWQRRSLLEHGSSPMNRG